MKHDWSDVELVYLLEIICDSLKIGGEYWAEEKRSVLILLISDVRRQLEARSQKPEARSQKPEARSQKPEARSQKRIKNNELIPIH